MLVPILALVACEVDLTLTAGAIGIGLRRSSLAATVAATGLISSVFAAAIFLVWILWFVAPACVAGGTCPGQSELSRPYAYLAAGAVAQWGWMLAVALATRRQTRERRGMRVSTEV